MSTCNQFGNSAFALVAAVPSLILPQTANSTSSEPPIIKPKRFLKKWYPSHIIAFLEEFISLNDSTPCNYPNTLRVWWDTLIEKVEKKFEKIGVAKVNLSRDIVKEKLRSLYNGYIVRLLKKFEVAAFWNKSNNSLLF